MINMGITRKELFTDSQNELANLTRVLGHPARIAILEHLLKSGICINTNLVQELGLAQATISQHLRELKDLGIIRGSIEGTKLCYCIDSEKWSHFQNLISDFFSRFHPGPPQVCC